MDQLSRIAQTHLEKALKRSPVVALLGPRQSGKSTLAKMLLTDKSVYLDLQNREDIRQLNEPELFFDANRDHLICLDEIQLLPEFFNVLRSEVDKDRRNGRFLLLGSASRDLIQHSSETLAGRIAYVELTPFLWQEVSHCTSLQSHWLRGGFPDALLAENDEQSFAWREDFIRTFLERDIPQFGYQIPVPLMLKLWTLLAHYNGQLTNFSKMAQSLDISTASLKKYLYLLEQTYMVRLLPAYESNIKKRLVKSPKIYLRDTGILHNLLAIENMAGLLSHPNNGASWEAYAVEQVCNAFHRWQPYFMRSSNDAELDLVLLRGQKIYAFEFKMSKAPKVSRGFFELIKDIHADKAFVIAPVDKSYAYNKNVQVLSLSNLADVVP